MPDITKIKIGNERERSYKDFPANREFKKRAEDDNPGSGGWPADLPKPSVGGYGYTEQGEQTVVVVDNESITTVAASGMNYGQFATPFDIVDGAYTVIFNGTEYNLNSTLFEELGDYIIGEVTESGYDFSRYPFIIVNANGMTILVTESAGDYVVTVKTTPDVIHKLDNKYYDSVINYEIEYGAERESVIAVYNKIKDAIKNGQSVMVTETGEYGSEVYPVLSSVDSRNNDVSFMSVEKRSDGIVISLYKIDNRGNITKSDKIISI